MKTNLTSVYIINDLMNNLADILKNEKMICNFKFYEQFLNVYIRDDSKDNNKPVIDVSISYDRLRKEGFDEIMNKIVNKLNGYLTYKDMKI